MTPFDPRLTLIAAQAGVKTCHVYHCWQAMRVLGKGFHIGAFAIFSGLEDRHVMAIISALTDNEALPEGRAKVERRASRLPDDFQAPAEWIEWAVERRHWTPTDAHDEAELFANYWQSKPGAQACKLDWFKTFQNWCKTSRRADGIYYPPREQEAGDRAEWLRSSIALYEKLGRASETTEWRSELATLEQSNVVPFAQRSEQKIAV